MKTPRGLMGAALLFWGWQTGMILFAVAAAVILEASHWIGWRLELSDADFNRVWDVTGVLLLGAALYQYSLDTGAVGSLAFFRWLPLVLLLMAVVQAYGEQESIAYTTFSWFLRRRQRLGDIASSKRINISYPYLGIVLLAASATTEREQTFYWVMSFLVGWALWPVRSRRLARPIWIGLLGAVVGFGWFTHQGLSLFQAHLEGRVSEWISQLGSARQFDPREVRTDMGRIRAMKESGRVVMHVQPEEGAEPSRLRQATYDAFNRGTWYANTRDFQVVPFDGPKLRWKLSEAKEGNRVSRISMPVPRKKALLSVPWDGSALETLAIGELEMSGFGIVRAVDAPGFLTYRVFHGSEKGLGSEPRDEDLVVPKEEQQAMEALLREAGWEQFRDAEEKLAAVEDWFAQGYEYALDVPENVTSGKGLTPLGTFLLNTRKGHCEYYASATVLLLRMLGVPSRYAVGYAVQEAKSDHFVVRERHGHAWALAWIGGRWMEVDTTPGGWLEIDEMEAGGLDVLSELWARVKFTFLRWRWSTDEDSNRLGLLVPLVPLLGFLLWRVFSKSRKAVRSEKWILERPGSASGLDSEWYQVEAALAAHGYGRQPPESWNQWLQRLQENWGDSELIVELQAIGRLHRRYRFDPQGLSAAERAELRESAMAWLGRWQRRQAAEKQALA